MLTVYDLYDLYAIIIKIRFWPNYELNSEIMLKVIAVLNNPHENYEYNQFRTTLSSIHFLDQDKYKFVFTQNVYTYFPSFLKDEQIYNILIETCDCLLKTIKDNNEEKIGDLADCLHNLPLYIADKIISENKPTIPQEFWKREVKHYRNKWDKDFLANIKYTHKK